MTSLLCNTLLGVHCFTRIMNCEGVRGVVASWICHGERVELRWASFMSGIPLQKVSSTGFRYSPFCNFMERDTPVFQTRRVYWCSRESS